jgi:hypothetical protein
MSIWFEHNYPYTNFHEMNLDYLLKQQKELAEKVDGIASVNSSFFEHRNAFYVDRPVDRDGKWYYISVHGDDDNGDGLTEETAFRTIRKAIETASLKYSDIRLRVCASGTYDVDYLLYTNNALHIDITAPDVILNYTTVGIHYMTHINLTGYSEENKTTIRCENQRNLWYMDGGSCIFDNINWECTVRLNQAGGEAFRCSFTSLLLFDSKFSIAYHVGFKNSTDYRGAIYLFNSDLFNTTPNILCELVSDDPNPFLYARGSRISNTLPYTNNTGFKWDKVDIGQSIYITSITSHNALTNFVRNVNVAPNNTISNIQLS